ncbi:MAG: GntR family transcriptional regulator [Anaerolineae bacterium]
MALNDLSRVVQRTLTDEATERLRSAIRNGTLEPGSRLVEQDLAQRLGMSRIPIREAMQRLVEEGIVIKEPHRGSFVYLPSVKDIEEIASLRAVLEEFVVERVIVRWNDECEAQLRAIVEQMALAQRDHDHQRMYHTDNEFHGTLWKIADHSILLEIASSLRGRISLFLYEAIALNLGSDEYDVNVAGHQRLIEMLKRGDLQAAKVHITDHIMTAKGRILHCWAQRYPSRLGPVS